MLRNSFRLFLWGIFAAVLMTSAIEASDNRLDQAREFVEAGDKYLHHSKLKRGMEGYGLTVMYGAEPQRFEAKIVSVVDNFGPGKDVILAELSGLGLEKTRIISGMSGSPVYMKDPSDGKFKMIGAVAYGWTGQIQPLCGIQPITQMLAAGGMKISDSATQPSSRPSSLPQSAWKGDSEAFVKAFTDPEKKDFSAMLNVRQAKTAGVSAMQMVPLKTPLMVSGASPETLELIESAFGRFGMTAVQAGAAGGASDDVDPKYKQTFVPGGVIVVPFTRGDMELSGLGTVTEVMGDQVFAFGHSMFSEGKVELPVAAGYVHTVVGGILSSFKLGNGYEPIGTLYRDEETAIVSDVSRQAKMFPMDVTINLPELSVVREHHYEVVNHNWITDILVRLLLMQSSAAWSSLPMQHNVQYDVSVDFGDIGVFKSSNISTMTDIMPILSDTIRPVAAMLNNPFGPPVTVKGIKVNMTVRSGNIAAEIKDISVPKDYYKPGETITARITAERFRQPRTIIPVSFRLPENIEEGDYTLQIGDWDSDMRIVARTQPHLFKAKSAQDMFMAMQKAVSERADNIYMRLVLDKAGIAIDRSTLPDLPASKAALIGRSQQIDASIFVDSILQTQKTQYVPKGSATIKFKVVKHNNETAVTE